MGSGNSSATLSGDYPQSMCNAPGYSSGVGGCTRSASGAMTPTGPSTVPHRALGHPPNSGSIRSRSHAQLQGEQNSPLSSPALSRGASGSPLPGRPPHYPAELGSTASSCEAPSTAPTKPFAPLNRPNAYAVPGRSSLRGVPSSGSGGPPRSLSPQPGRDRHTMYSGSLRASIGPPLQAAMATISSWPHPQQPGSFSGPPRSVSPQGRSPSACSQQQQRGMSPQRAVSPQRALSPQRGPSPQRFGPSARALSPQQAGLRALPAGRVAAFGNLYDTRAATPQRAAAAERAATTQQCPGAAPPPSVTPVRCRPKQGCSAASPAAAPMVATPSAQWQFGASPCRAQVPMC